MFIVLGIYNFGICYYVVATIYLLVQVAVDCIAILLLLIISFVLYILRGMQRPEQKLFYMASLTQSGFSEQLQCIFRVGYMVHISVSWNNTKWDQRHLKSQLEIVCSTYSQNIVSPNIVSPKYSKVYIILKLKQQKQMFYAKLYIPSTLNTDLIFCQPQWILASIKC